MVKIEPIKEEGGYEYRINNKYDARYNPRPVDEIVSEAKAAVGTKVSYNLLNNNCEHFVTNLRYGVPVSDQPVVHFCYISSGEEDSMNMRDVHTKK
ncbi:UNVERIFIED_CONTAM: hypothetical protein K2H54_011044 [Gekko kuhli]